MERVTNYHLIFTDYNNMFEKTYTWMDVEKSTFDMDWTRIINAQPRNYIYGFTDFRLQTYMHDNGIFYLHRGSVDYEWIMNYINANDFNKEHSKIIEHSNIGNY